MTASAIPFSVPYDGKPINKPGIYSRVPLSVYHGAALCDGPSISSGGCRTMILESMAHYWCHSALNPDCIEVEPTEEMILGAATHHLILGEKGFALEYAVRPDTIDGKPWHGSRTVCKDWNAARADEGRAVLKATHIDTIRGMAKSLASHPLVQRGILNGQIEQTLVWKCKETGYWLKARPDALPNDSGDFVDLKTISSVQTHTIKSAIAERGYHMQGSWVGAGWHALTGAKDYTFTLVFVEKRPPFCVRIVGIPDEDLMRGEQLNQLAMRKFAKAMEAGEWPGPGGADGEFLYLPEWAQKSIDYQLEQAKEA